MKQAIDHPDTWRSTRIVPEEIERYRSNGRDFIDPIALHQGLAEVPEPDRLTVRDILAKAEAVQTLTPQDAAALIKVRNSELWEELKLVAAKVKPKAYDNRIVTFAPFSVSNRCVNNYVYCGCA